MRRTALLTLAALGLSTVFIAAAPARADGTVSRQLSSRLPELNFQGVTFGDALDFIRDVSGANITVNWKALEGAGITKDAQVNMHLTSISLRKALQMLLTEASGGDTITYVVDQGVIEITTRDLADHMMITRVYPVEDLLMEIPDFNDAPEFSLDASQNQGNTGGGSGGGSGGGASIGGVSNTLFAGGANGTNGNSQPTKTKAERAQDLVALIEAVVSPDIWKDNGGTASIKYFNGMLVVTAPRSVQEAIGGEYD
ncbi:MAG TPA: hypothetical protein VGI81_27255 [Tepidisphaeraceae bacterium]|jgi:uncharacterized membrane protein YgcG